MNNDIVCFTIWQIVSFYRCGCRLQITKVLREHVYLKCTITILLVLKALKREKKINHYLCLCLIMTVVKTKAILSVRVVTHAFTQPDTYMHSCYCMNDSCSVTTPAPWKSCMTSTDKKTKQKCHRRFKNAWLPLGKMGCTLCSKTAWPLMRKARTNTMLRTLIPQSCQ